MCAKSEHSCFHPGHVLGETPTSVKCAVENAIPDEYIFYRGLTIWLIHLDKSQWGCLCATARWSIEGDVIVVYNLIVIELGMSAVTKVLSSRFYRNRYACQPKELSACMSL